MRTFGKVCCWLSAIGLVGVAIMEFNGTVLSNNWVGVFFILFAAESALDGATCFKKPKRQFVKYTFLYDDGTSEKHIVANDMPYELYTSSNKALETININYFESDKDEVSKNE